MSNFAKKVWRDPKPEKPAKIQRTRNRYEQLDLFIQLLPDREKKETRKEGQKNGKTKQCIN